MLDNEHVANPRSVWAHRVDHAGAAHATFKMTRVAMDRRTRRRFILRMAEYQPWQLSAATS